jgi:acetyl-CoA carboxylase alpha subunit
MKPILAGTLALLAAPALAQDYATPDHRAAADAVAAFMEAIASDDKTLLAQHMIPEGVIFIHNRMDPENPRIDTVPVARHLERWATRSGDYEEIMRYDTVEVEGDMAQVWGPYSFRANGALTHCGINSISLVRGPDGVWKVGNTSFSMVAPEACAQVGADWVDGEGG